MSKPAKKPCSSQETGIDADNFWELIEKLLLHSSSDEKARTRHNLSLSALCKGQALPPLPRPDKPQMKKTYRKLKQIEKEKTKLEEPNSIKRIAKLSTTTEKASNEKITNEHKHQAPELSEEIDKIKRQIVVVSNLTKTFTDDTDTLVANSETKRPNEKKRLREKDTSIKSPECTTLSKTTSECSLKDLRIQLVKDINVPASERLWRFAMHNKKQKEDVNVMRASVISRARSNEAIYRGLRERLDEAEKEAAEKEVIQQKAKKLTQCANCVPTEMSKTLKEAKEVAKAQVTKPAKPKKHSCPTDAALTGNGISCHQAPCVSVLNSQASCHNNTQRDQFKRHLTTLVESNLSGDLSSPLFKQQDFNQRKVLYDRVLKKRLRCGCKLDSLNKEIAGKGNPRLFLNNDTTKRYNELKSEYLNLCHKESQLKHQIAILNAEIYMMQNKGYHKTPASLKTITLDSKTPLQPESEACFKDCFPLPPVAAPFFPPLKPPRPLLHSRAGQERIAERFDSKKQKLCKNKEERTSQSEVASQSVNSLPDIESRLSICSAPQQDCEKVGYASVCSLFSLDANLTPPVKHEPEPLKENKVKQEQSLIKLIHRLPKLRSADVL